jgi:LysM repeat protein
VIRRLLLLVLLLAIPAQVSADSYTVQPGDTLTGIAHSHNISIGVLARANHITNPNVIRAGTVLLIPAPVRRVSARYFWYRVQWGDTLIGLAGKYGLYVSTIRSINPSLGTYPLAGQWLRLCGPCTSYTVTEPVSRPGLSDSVGGSGAGFYVVRAGDSLSTIAARYGTSISGLLSANRVLNPDRILIGTRLTIPQGTQAATPAVGSTAAAPWSVRGLITSWAAYYGVDGALALAIGWQESGFNENALSATGAIGVMQVEPYTGARIGQLLGRQINLYLTSDNVQAGVYWLWNLLRYYGGNESLAIAAYYQGTRSIARFGLYADTRQYVADVQSLQVQFGG